MKTSTFRNRGFSAKLIACGLLLFVASCKKDSDVVTPDGGSSLPCVGKNLRLTALAFDPAVDLNGDGKPDGDLMGYVPACARDNTIVFEKGGKLSGSEGATVCPADEADNNPTAIEPSTWTYNTETQILRITPNGNPADANEWKVREASATRIKAVIEMASDEGDKLNMVMTWQAQ